MQQSSILGGEPPQPRASDRDRDALDHELGKPVELSAPGEADDAADPTAERIDVDDEQALEDWADKLDTTPEQLRDAVDQVGDLAADVEMHLKGTHSTTNADRIEDAGGD